MTGVCHLAVRPADMALQRQYIGTPGQPGVASRVRHWPVALWCNAVGRIRPIIDRLTMPTLIDADHHD